MTRSPEVPVRFRHDLKRALPSQELSVAICEPGRGCRKRTTAQPLPSRSGIIFWGHRFGGLPPADAPLTVCYFQEERGSLARAANEPLLRLQHRKWLTKKRPLDR
jgi:hypothetical protein